MSTSAETKSNTTLAVDTVIDTITEAEHVEREQREHREHTLTAILRREADGTADDLFKAPPAPTREKSGSDATSSSGKGAKKTKKSKGKTILAMGSPSAMQTRGPVPPLNSEITADPEAAGSAGSAGSSSSTDAVVKSKDTGTKSAAALTPVRAPAPVPAPAAQVPAAPKKAKKAPVPFSAGALPPKVLFPENGHTHTHTHTVADDIDAVDADIYGVPEPVAPKVHKTHKTRPVTAPEPADEQVVPPTQSTQPTEDSDDFQTVGPKVKQVVAYPGWNCRSRVPAEYPAYLEWYEKNYLYTYSATVAQAQEAVAAVKNLILKHPETVAELILHAAERGFNGTNIAKFPLDSIVLEGGLIKKNPDIDEVGILVKQVLTQFDNPALAEAVPSVCKEILHGFRDAMKKLGGSVVYDLACTVRYSSPVREKKTINDYFEDTMHIELKFGTAGWTSEDVEKYRASKPAKHAKGNRYPVQKSANRGFSS